MSNAAATRSNMEQVHDYLTGSTTALPVEAVQGLLWEGPA